MNIGIDARFYGTQVKGLGRYTQKLIENFAKLDHNFDFTIFLTSQGLEEFDIKDNRIKPVKMDIPWYGIREQYEVPRELKKHNLDLMHFTHFNVPYVYRGKFVVTIHDLILLDQLSKRSSKLSIPKFYLKYFAHRINLSKLMKSSEAAITVSDYSRSRIIHYFPKAIDKIFVTHLSGDQKPRNEVEYTKEDMGINQPYLLYVGNAFPHKNLEFLIRSFNQFWKTEAGRGFQLVLVGKLDYFYSRLQGYINQFDWNGDCPVKIFGYATEDQLGSLYKNADLYVFPSLEEGFGLPPLEAMQHCTPVLSSNKSCMPEILGHAAAYFDPNNSDDFVDKISKITRDEDFRETLIKKGNERIKLYSWGKCAKETLGVYNRALK